MFLKKLFQPPAPAPASPQFAIYNRLKSPVHVSHRGGSSYAPQNTLYSFRKCVAEDNTDMLEFDVHKTKDGHLVLNHNLSIEATTNGEGLIENMTFEELRRLDAAHNFTTDGSSYPLRGTGIQMPTLQEVLDEFVPNEKLVFLVDLKHKDAVAPTIKVIEEYGIQERVIFGAVPPVVNQELLRLRPTNIPVIADAKTMLVTVLMYNLGLLRFSPIKHDVVGFYVDARTNKWIPDALITRLLGMGYWIGVFGPYLDSAEHQKRFIDLGVQLICTDRPDVLRQTMAGAIIETVKETVKESIGSSSTPSSLPTPSEPIATSSSPIATPSLNSSSSVPPPTSPLSSTPPPPLSSSHSPPSTLSANNEASQPIDTKYVDNW